MPTNLLLGFCFVLLLQSITRLGLAVQLGFPLLWSLTRKHVWSDVKAGVGMDCNSILPNTPKV